MQNPLSIESFTPIYLREVVKLLYQDDVENSLVKLEDENNYLELKQHIEAKMIRMLRTRYTFYGPGVKETIAKLLDEFPPPLAFELEPLHFQKLTAFIQNLKDEREEQNRIAAEKEVKKLRKVKETVKKAIVDLCAKDSLTIQNQEEMFNEFEIQREGSKFFAVCPGRGFNEDGLLEQCRRKFDLIGSDGRIDPQDIKFHFLHCKHTHIFQPNGIEMVKVDESSDDSDED